MCVRYVGTYQTHLCLHIILDSEIFAQCLGQVSAFCCRFSFVKGSMLKMHRDGWIRMYGTLQQRFKPPWMS